MGAHRALTVEIISAKILRRHAEYTMEVFLSGRKVWTVERRYTHFRLVHKDLKRNYTQKDCFLSCMSGTLSQASALPNLPSRVLVKNRDRAFVESRRLALQEYLDGVLKLYGNKLPCCVWELLGLGGRLRAPVLTSDAAELMASTHGLAEKFKQLHASVYASVQASVLASHAASGHASLFSLSGGLSGYMTEPESEEEEEDEKSLERQEEEERLSLQEEQKLEIEQHQQRQLQHQLQLRQSLQQHQLQLQQSSSMQPPSNSIRIDDDNEWLKSCEALFKNTWNSA